MNNKPKHTEEEVLKIVCNAIKKHRIRHYSKIWGKITLPRYYGRRDSLKHNKEVKDLLEENLQKHQNDYIKLQKKDFASYKEKALSILRETEERVKAVNGENYIQRKNALIVKPLFLASALGVSYQWYKDIGLIEDDEINQEIEHNVTQVKMKKYSDLINNTEHNACLSTIKLLGSDEERNNLGAKVDHSSKGEKIGTTIEITEEEIEKINKQLEKDF